MQSKAPTVAQYLEELPPDRKRAIQAVRKVIRANLDPGFAELMQYGMIGYAVPHRVYPAGYHCDPKQPLPFAALASQKNYMSIYLMCLYESSDLEAWFRAEWLKTGLKLDFGKCCVRFRKLEDLPLDLIGRLINRVSVEEHIRQYESALADRVPRKRASGNKPSKKTKA